MKIWTTPKGEPIVLRNVETWEPPEQCGDYFCVRLTSGNYINVSAKWVEQANGTWIQGAIGPVYRDFVQAMEQAK